LPMFETLHEISVVTKAVCKPVRTCNSQGQLRLFTAPSFLLVWEAILVSHVVRRQVSPPK